MMLERLKPRDEAIEKIENYIIKNELKSDDKLPSERRMCELFQVNRSTLRSAIRQLIQEGKIYHKNGSGTFVAKNKLIRNLQDDQSFFQTAKKAGRDVQIKILRFDSFEANESLSKKMNVLFKHKLWYLECLGSLDNIPVTVNRVYLDAERFPNLATYDLTKQTLNSILQDAYGVGEINGDEKISITTCDEREAELLEVPLNTPVIYQSGRILDLGGTTVECFKELTLAQYVCFVSELKRR